MKGIVIIVMMALFSFSGCNTADPEKAACEFHQDCPVGYSCVNSECVSGTGQTFPDKDSGISEKDTSERADEDIFSAILPEGNDDGLIHGINSDNSFELSGDDETASDDEATIDDEATPDDDTVIYGLTITEKPGTPVTDETYTFKFAFTTGADEHFKFKCRLEVLDDIDNECKDSYNQFLRVSDCHTRNIESERCDGLWYDCESPKLYFKLPDGTYRFSVKAEKPFALKNGTPMTKEYLFQIDRKLPCYVYSGSREGHSHYQTPPVDDKGKFTAALAKITSFQDTRRWRENGTLDIDYIRIYAEIEENGTKRICLMDGEMINKPNPNCYNGDMKSYTNNTGTCWGGWFGKWFADNNHNIFTEMPSRDEDIISFNAGAYPDKVLLVWGTRVYVPENIKFTRIWAAARVKISGDLPTAVGLDFYRDITSEWDEGEDNVVTNLGNIEEGMLSEWHYGSKDWQVLYNKDSVPAGWIPKQDDSEYCGFPLRQ